MWSKFLYLVPSPHALFCQQFGQQFIRAGDTILMLRQFFSGWAAEHITITSPALPLHHSGQMSAVAASF
jgi:hypothetical protein